MVVAVETFVAGDQVPAADPIQVREEFVGVRGTRMPVNWDSRVSALERLAREKVGQDDRLAESRAAADWPLDEMIGHIPGPLRQSVTDAIRAGGPVGEYLLEWLDEPFAQKSKPVTPDFLFPVALVEFLLRPPREFWIGHACKACGLAVPAFLTWANDPDPPPSVQAFPVCPACGGGTGSW